LFFRFGEDTAERVHEFIQDMEDIDKENSTIIDLGCGNGYTLFELVREIISFSQSFSP
jgi:hypothetical protein